MQDNDLILNAIVYLKFRSNRNPITEISIDENSPHIRKIEIKHNQGIFFLHFVDQF